MHTFLHNKVILVTGGARGLGEAICRVLAADGAVVIALDRLGDQVRELAADIRREGGTASGIVLDITDDVQVRSTLEGIHREFGAIDVLVNNAGIDVSVPVGELAVADWDRVMAVNLRAPFLLSQTVFPYMAAQGKGHIVNIVSTAAKRSWANASVYHASKWGLLGFSHALHVEGRSQGIKVTAVIAGGMKTPFLLDRFPWLDPDTLQAPANVAATVRFVLSTPDETVIPEVMVIPMTETSWP